jgi:hypothetical protein
MNKHLDVGIKAYQKAKEKGLTNKDLLIFVDFTLPSTKKRLWVIQPSTGEVLMNLYVTHGINSGKGLMATSFGNVPGSFKSSIGVMRTKSTYISPKAGTRRLQIEGLEKGFNDKVLSRAIVIHEARYIGPNPDGTLKTGHSEGCFAVPLKDAKPLIDLVKSGVILVSFYPDEKWLKTSEYVK